MKANCVACGKEFDKLKNAKTCGRDCGEEWRRGRQREVQRRYRAAHPERAREWAREASRRYRAAHPERAREADRRCRAARRERAAGGVPG